MTTRKQALISVSDKSGITELAKTFLRFNIELLSTGGTARLLKDAGLPVTEIGDYTGFPEMLDGRVKTLHPKVHGGILARRSMETIIILSLYPWKQNTTIHLAKKNFPQ